MRLPSAEDSDSAEEHYIEASFDLFEPPVHIAFVSEVIAARERVPQPTYKQIGNELDISYMTVKRVVDYRKRMVEFGTIDPYLEIDESPANASRWRKLA